jgi:hypothetical protein
VAGRVRLETYGLPRPVFYTALAAPTIPVAAIGGYLLYRYPRAPLIAIPVVLVAGYAIAILGARRWPAGNAHYRAVLLPIWGANTYMYTAAIWEIGGPGGGATAAGMAVLILVPLALAGEPQPGDMVMRPVERDPDDWRWTTPS